jgi:hypothetical protein
MDFVSLHWNNSPVFGNAAKNLASKFKHIRAGLKNWSKQLSNLNKLIYNCRWVLSLLDGLEDQRNLSRMELNFRNLVKQHLSSLLESKRVYWKQRNTLRLVKLADENTEFFHSFATISHKRNFIVSLTSTDGDSITNHEQKANLIWSSFKDRMGASDFKNISYDLSSLLVPQNLSEIDSDFSQEEIDLVIKTLLDSHAPGPDGFNGLFIKKC